MSGSGSNDASTAVVKTIVEYKYFPIIRTLVSAAIEGILVAFVALYLVRRDFPNTRREIKDAVYLGLVAAAAFAVLDTVSSKVADGARTGAGFAIGARMAGGL